MSVVRSIVLAAIVGVSAVAPLHNASGQSYPSKPIHLIVPYPAGGGTGDQAQGQFRAGRKVHFSALHRDALVNYKRNTSRCAAILLSYQTKTRKSTWNNKGCHPAS